ncbi:glucuronate isomerase [Paenibacillus woosongensis]|uniref:Uronate isomerase n=1 Tax=Paenibacillus woosongensis TaxID=307580 RepID=A0AA95I3I8_9BACL|nr:glucuronate isomerase [Paenibacillus woosongensis]WHX48181.1 glucuronate isomerase [Paenibacillus woosongensis]
MTHFYTENLLLTNNSAKKLYFEYAAGMPIYDYHNHLNPADVAANKQFRNLTELWLDGDHYKWRAMRWLGIDESLITGEAGDQEKFMAWARAVPRLVGNPLYHWSHLELARYFGIEERLSEENAEEIWHRCNERLQEKSLRAAGILEQFDVRVACTTDDPADTLAAHGQIANNEEIAAKVLPTFRPDRALNITAPGFQEYMRELGQAAGCTVGSYEDLLEVLKNRIDYFHAKGCRLSDHGFGAFPFERTTEREAGQIFAKALRGEMLTESEENRYRTFTLLRLGEMYYDRGWAMQLHIGAIRNNNDRMLKTIGKDSGYDSILDYHLAASLNAFLNELETGNRLPKTIVYSLYPYHYEMLATTIGNFQSGESAGKLQLGSAWWFNDQKEGMLQQLKALSSIGVISTFVGMLTDSRSFMSLPRHEYFRRVLCRLFGEWIEEGELPADYDYIGGIVQDICYHNAVRYFGISLS